MNSLQQKSLHWSRQLLVPKTLALNQILSALPCNMLQTHNKQQSPC